MFKLVKIMNKSNNAPEIEYFKSYGDVVVSTGDIGFIFDERLTNVHFANCAYNDVKTLYYTHGEAPFEDDTTLVPCTRITPDMIFEVGYTKSLPNGTKLTLLHTETNLYSSIAECEAGDICFMEVYSNKNFDSSKKLQVRFCNIPERINE